MYLSPQNAEQVLQTVQLHTELEKVLDPGIDMDVIFVNNVNRFIKGEQFLESIKGQAASRGVFKLMHRPNVGGAFGGFAQAFLENQNDYDYFIFCEDDLFINQPQIPALAVHEFNTRPNLGYVAFGPVVTGTVFAPHVGGGFGMGKREVLQRLCAEKGGMLPHPHDSSYGSMEALGEVPFTHWYFLNGYEVTHLPGRPPYCVNHQKHPHGTLSVRMGVDLQSVPSEHFFYQVGCLDPEYPLPL